MKRLTTWSMVVGAGAAADGCSGAACAADAAACWDGCAVGGADGCESAVCCATALIEASRAAVNIAFQLRITLFSIFLDPVSSTSFSGYRLFSLLNRQITSPKLLVRQRECHMNDRRRINRLSTVQRRFEPDLVGGSDSGFVQSMAQTADNAIYMQGSVRRKTDFEQHFAFDLHIARLVGINRVRLGHDFDRRARAYGIRLRDLRSTMHHLLRSESSGGNAAIHAPVAAGNAAAEICAGDGSLNSFSSARPVALSGTRGQVKRSGRGGI